MSCCICSEDLQLSTVVNTHCGHQFCGDCFWKWMKTKNTCPLCRKDILYNSEELQENRHLRGLLDHRASIVKQVEEAYDEKDDLDREISIRRIKCSNLKTEEKEREEKRRREKNPYHIMKQQQLIIEERLKKTESNQKKHRDTMIKELNYVLYAYLPCITITKIKIKEYKKKLERQKRRYENMRNHEEDMSVVLTDMFYLEEDDVNADVSTPVHVDRFIDEIGEYYLINSPSNYEWQEWGRGLSVNEANERIHNRIDRDHFINNFIDNYNSFYVR